MTFKKSKRGQWLQITILVAFVILFAFVGVFMNNVSNELNTAIQVEDDIAQQAKDIVSVNNTAQGNIFDSIGLLVFVGLWFGALVGAYNAPSHPLALVLAIFIVVGLGVSSMYLSNVWDDLENDGSLSSYAANFPMTSFLLQNYLIAVLIVGFSTVAVFVMRFSGGYG